MPTTVRIQDDHEITEIKEPSNNFGIYTGLFYFLFIVFIPPILTGLNMLGSYAPNTNKSLGRVLLEYMTWTNDVTDSEISKPLLQYIMPALFLVALGCIASTHCTSGRILEKEEGLPEHKQSELLHNRRMNTLQIMPHVLAGTNIPLVLFGSFLNGFFLAKKDFSTSFYMAFSATLGTTLLTTFSYLIFGMGYCFRKNCCTFAKPQAIAIENTQSATGTTGGVVIQMHPLTESALAAAQPHGHGRTDSDIQRAVRETISVIDARTGQRRMIASHENLEAVGTNAAGETVIARRQEVRRSNLASQGSSPLFTRRRFLPHSDSIEEVAEEVVPHTVTAARNESSESSPTTRI